MNSKFILSFWFVLSIILYSCSGVETSNLSSYQDMSESDSYTADDSECLQWLSAANVNRENGSYQDCVNAYNISPPGGKLD